MRTAIDKEARATGRHALLLSLALSNSNRNAQESYDIPTIARYGLTKYLDIA